VLHKAGINASRDAFMGDWSSLVPSVGEKVWLRQLSINHYLISTASQHHIAYLSAHFGHHPVSHAIGVAIRGDSYCSVCIMPPLYHI
jgi:hypothetical protein